MGTGGGLCLRPALWNNCAPNARGSAGEGIRPKTSTVHTARLVLVYAGQDSTSFRGVTCVPPGPQLPLRRAWSPFPDGVGLVTQGPRRFPAPIACGSLPHGQGLDSARPLAPTSVRLRTSPCQALRLLTTHMSVIFCSYKLTSGQARRGLDPGLRSRASARTPCVTLGGTRSAMRVTGFSLPLSSRWPPHLGNGGENRPRPVQASKYRLDVQP